MDNIGTEIATLIIEQSTPIISLYPGKFKPPTKSHFEVVEKASKLTDQVTVIISKKEKDDFNMEQSILVWNLYKKYLPSNVYIKVAKNSSPVTEVYEIIKDKTSDYFVIYGKEDEVNFKNIIDKPEVYFNVKPVHAGITSEVSATQLRKAIEERNIEEIKKCIPSQVNPTEFLEIFGLNERKSYHDKLVAMAKRKDPDRLTNLGKQYLPENWNGETFPEEKRRFLDQLINYSCDFLNINKPIIEIIDDEDYTREHKSFGGYIPSEQKLLVVVRNRNLADIMRSTAHELVHHKQNSNGELESTSGEDGDKWENEANSIAGVIMRKFGRENPEIFE